MLPLKSGALSINVFELYKKLPSFTNLRIYESRALRIYRNQFGRRKGRETPWGSVRIIIYTRRAGKLHRDPFSAASKPNFATKYSLESSRRDLHSALRSTTFQSQKFVKHLPTSAEIYRKSATYCRNFQNILKTFAEISPEFVEFFRQVEKSDAHGPGPI